MSSPSPHPSPVYPIPTSITTFLDDARASNQRVALLTCGITGSGKSTLSRSICTTYPTFTRLSIDAYVHQHYGVHDVDFPASSYSSLQESAELELKAQLGELLKEHRDVVLDMSFYSKEFRDEWRGLVEEGGGGRYRILLVVFKGNEEVLWRRIEGRRESIRGKGEGVTIDRETLKMYLEGFEWPEGEGEIVIEVV